MGILRTIARTIGDVVSPKPVASQWTWHQLTAIGAQVERPLDWHVRTDVPGALVCFVKPGAAQVSIGVEPLRAGETLPDVLRGAKARVTDGGGQIVNEWMITLDDGRGTPAFLIDYLQGESRRTVTGLTQGNSMFSLDCSTRVSTFNQYLPVFKRFVNSLRWT